MTPEAALRAFFQKAVPGWAAYPETSVPSKIAGDALDAAFPYLTYSNADAEFDAGEVSITVNLWDYSRKEERINAAKRTLYDAVGRGGIQIECDGGIIWLKRGNPFSQAIADDDPRLKRRYIRIRAEYNRE